MQPALTNQLNNAFTLFLSLLVEAIPFLLLGVLFSGLLLGFVDERKLVSRIPRNPLLGALMGSSIGFLFPVCECGNVPVARRLLMQGVPAPAAIDCCERSKMSNGFYKPVFNPTYNLEMEIFRGQHVEYLVSDQLLLVTIAPLRKLLSE